MYPMIFQKKSNNSLVKKRKIMKKYNVILKQIFKINLKIFFIIKWTIQKKIMFKNLMDLELTLTITQILMKKTKKNNV